MAKPIEQDVLETIRSAVTSALSAAATAGNISTTGQVVVGWPASTQLTEILANAQSQVSLYMLEGGKQDTRYPPEWVSIAQPNVPLIATVSGGTVTFSGSVVAGLNIHTFVGNILQDAYYQTVLEDNLASVATHVASAINALAISGVTATPSGNGLSVTGSYSLACNIGASSVAIAREAHLWQRCVQISIWAPDPNTRYAMTDPILSSIGTIDNSFLTLSNGMTMRIYNSGRQSWNKDKLQLSYSCYQAHYIFDVEYYSIAQTTSSQIESLEQDVSLNGASAIDLIAS